LGFKSGNIGSLNEFTNETYCKKAKKELKTPKEKRFTFFGFNVKLKSNY
jgi:hypothetical protein